MGEGSCRVGQRDVMGGEINQPLLGLKLGEGTTSQGMQAERKKQKDKEHNHADTLILFL